MQGKKLFKGLLIRVFIFDTSRVSQCFTLMILPLAWYSIEKVELQRNPQTLAGIDSDMYTYQLLLVSGQTS